MARMTIVGEDIRGWEKMRVMMAKLVELQWSQNQHSEKVGQKGQEKTSRTCNSQDL